MIKIDFIKKNLKVIGLTVLILVLEAVVIFYFANAINGRISEIKEKNRLLAIAKAERLSSVSLQNDFLKIEPFLPNFENILPTEDNLYYAVKQIELLGNRTGNLTVINIISPSAAFDGVAGANYVLYRATLDGNYGSLRNYLKELRNSQFLMDINSLSISGQPSINNQSRIEFNGKIYIK